MLTASKSKLTKDRLNRLLQNLKAADENSVSIYLPGSLPSSDIEKTIAVIINDKEVLLEIVHEVSHSTNGAALFWGEQHKYLVQPPFPMTDKLISQGYDTELLEGLINQDLTIALVLVRMGAYGVGVFHNEKLLASKVGTGLVHGRHRQGGSSAHRFERHRDKQIEYFFTRVCLHMREKLEPYLQQINYLFYGGENFTIRSFREQCQFLKKLENRTLPRLLNIREPKQASLEEAIHDAWSSQVIQWMEK
jgi:peptide subunit release factor 1 (eRF1)